MNFPNAPITFHSLHLEAPPGEEDEEEKVHNGYQKENGNGSVKSERNTQGGYSSYKRTRPYNNGSNTYGYGYGSLYNGQSKSVQSKNEEDSTKPKIVFNEEEYMRITTPRQDVLFKKGYLSRKKPLASTASTSATSATTTPSTNESQSAAHSTADGSETAEDQQLLDGSNGGEYAIVPDTSAQFAYGGFYDQVTGYYYEYPVMLVGPPVPGHPSPNVLAAMSCGPVPLRPVEWFNPQYMPESFQEQHPPPHSTDSQAGSCGSSISMDEVGGSGAPVNTEVIDESGNGDEEVAEDIEAAEDVEVAEDLEAQVNGEAATECVQTSQIIPQIVPHMHMPPQHYVYPGHFMFGPPMVNMNGVTIQNGAIVPSGALWGKRKRGKKKRKKRRRPSDFANTENEEGEYSSDCESGSNWSQPAWSISTTIPGTEYTITSRPLNPEVQEFQFRSALPVPPDATDVSTLDSPDADTPSLSHTIEIKETTCEKTETDIETGLVSIDNTNLPTVTNANSKDKLSENTLENKRLKEANANDNELENNEHNIFAQNDKNCEIVNGDSQSRSTSSQVVENDPQSPSNGIEILEDNNSVTSNNSVDYGVGEKFEATNNVTGENIFDQLNTIKDETGLVEVKNTHELQITNSSDLCVGPENIESKSNGHLWKEENGNLSNFPVEENPIKSAEINGQNVKPVTSEDEKLNSSPVSNGKRPGNETSNKKGGNKNMKKGKAKAMDARKPARNKREPRNSQRNDATSSAVSSTGVVRERERSISPDTRRLLDLESSKLQLPLEKPSSRPTSPEINQTTTPINAETHRLPESYESLVTRSTPPSNTPPTPLLPAGGPTAPPRRKYSAKGLKFVREPTPGPDLDTEVKSDNEEGARIDDNSRHLDNKNASTSVEQGALVSPVPDDSTPQEQNENEGTNVSTEEPSSTLEEKTEIANTNLSVCRIESRTEVRGTDDEESQLELLGTASTSDAVDLASVNSSNKYDAIPNTSVDDSVRIDADFIGVSSQQNIVVGNLEMEDAASVHSDHPITDAVAAWLERTKSPDMFRVPMPISESDEDDLSETEIYDGDPNEKPSKNLQGNPMPALSVSNGSIDNHKRMRSNVVTNGNFTKTDAFNTSKPIERRREKDIDYINGISPINKNARSIQEILRSVRVCQFTINGSAAGMRVAENSRVDLNRINMEQKDRVKDRLKTNHIENIEMKVKSITKSNDDITESGIEALENVKTYERGEIVVSLDGKLLTGSILEPTCTETSSLQDPETTGEASKSSSNQREICKSRAKSIEIDESSVMNSNESERETSPGGTINSLGSIEEPDVLECWETEIIEPVIMLKNNRDIMKLQVDGEVHEGEATEEENYDNQEDPKTREHVKKYYRLAREYTMSFEEELCERALKQLNSNNISSTSNSTKRTTPNTPERMIECLCSEEIPIIVPLPQSMLTKSNKVVKDGKEIQAVDEAFEVYESCYTEKTRLASVVPQPNAEGSQIPFRNQEGPIPCKAVCCNIQ